MAAFYSNIEVLRNSCCGGHAATDEYTKLLDKRLNTHNDAIGGDARRRLSWLLPRPGSS